MNTNNEMNLYMSKKALVHLYLASHVHAHRPCPIHVGPSLQSLKHPKSHSIGWLFIRAVPTSPWLTSPPASTLRSCTLRHKSNASRWGLWHGFILMISYVPMPTGIDKFSHRVSLKATDLRFCHIVIVLYVWHYFIIFHSVLTDDY